MQSSLPTSRHRAAFLQPCVSLVLSGGLAMGLMSSAWSAPAKAKTPAVVKPSAPASFKGDGAAGLIKSESERCQECHGVDGNGAGHSNSAEGKFAKLAGQYPEYIVKQIQDFRSGVRKHDFMSIMAKSLEDADLVDIAAYFAAQPRMKGDGTGDNAVAKSLFANGDAARGVTACITCHGEAGKGLAGNPAPIIGGQEWRYLDKQLREWRTGERRNSDGGVMNQVLKPLTDAEIQSLADYLSGL